MTYPSGKTLTYEYDAVGNVAAINEGNAPLVSYILSNGGVALIRPDTLPARSDDVLVTETKYDVSTGQAFRTIDPAGKDHRTVRRSTEIVQICSTVKRSYTCVSVNL